jgi:hypothetical protein
MRDEATAMPAAGNAAHVMALRVWHCNYKSLADLRRYSSLRTLVVATYPDPDLEAVAALEQLEYLRLLHLPNVTDLAPLSRLQGLLTVRLETLPELGSLGEGHDG